MPVSRTAMGVRVPGKREGDSANAVPLMENDCMGSFQ